MTDERKRKLIRALSVADRLQAKSSRGGMGWRPTNLVYDDDTKNAEWESLTGEALNRELRRQLFVTIPWLLLILLVLGACIGGVILMFTRG